MCPFAGGFLQFEEHYPHLCQCGDGNELGKTLYSLSALKLSDGNNNSSSLGFTLQEYPQMRKEPCRYNPENSGPIEIIPHLYLGNKKDSGDRQCLANYQITYVLNVTHDLPNQFEQEEEFIYLKLPVEDNWEGNLVSLFPEAFAFIGRLSFFTQPLLYCIEMMHTYINCLSAIIEHRGNCVVSRQGHNLGPSPCTSPLKGCMCPFLENFKAILWQFC